MTLNQAIVAIMARAERRRREAPVARCRVCGRPLAPGDQTMCGACRENHGRVFEAWRKIEGAAAPGVR